MNIQEIDSQNLKSIFPLMSQLRPHLSFQEFSQLHEEAKRTGGYCLLGFFENDRCLGLLGYRFMTDFVHGKHIYIDDLVVDESSRSLGLGAQLLDHAKTLAQKAGCKNLRLCTGKDNLRGMQFYERNQWQQRAVVYKFKFPKQSS